MIEGLINLDKELLLSINSHHCLFLDNFMDLATSTYTWIPIYIYILYMFLRNIESKNRIILIISSILLVIITDQLTHGLIKPYFMRLRPTHCPEIMELVHTVNNYRGGMYGFVSNHAANTFAIAVFTACVIRSYIFSFIMFSLAILNSYSRIYLGVHYPGDIICGALLGALLGYLAYGITYYIRREHLNTNSFVSNEYTSTGYSIFDINVLLYIYLLIIAILCILSVCL